MNLEYSPADQEALERRNARAASALFAASQMEHHLTPVAIQALEEKLRDAEPNEAVQVTPDEMAAILNGRNSIHGDFTDDASISQAVKAAMYRGKNWQDLSDVQTEALEHIATKISRILSGDPAHKDHWLDIQGYAKLVSDRL